MKFSPPNILAIDFSSFTTEKLKRFVHACKIATNIRKQLNENKEPNMQ